MAEPRVIGIDDRAWRKGQRYGTLICDLERHRVIDLLPDREPATVEAWLKDHPGIGIVARDRNSGYAGAVARALPDAVHPLAVCAQIAAGQRVADRWHLPDCAGNRRASGAAKVPQQASEAFLLAVKKSMPAIRKAADALTLDPKMLSAAEKLQYEGFLRRRPTSQLVRQLADSGMA